MSNHVRVSAKYRKEPDYGKLARAILLFLEQQSESDLADDREANRPTPTQPDVDPSASAEGQSSEAAT